MLKVREGAYLFPIIVMKYFFLFLLVTVSVSAYTFDISYSPEKMYAGDTTNISVSWYFNSTEALKYLKWYHDGVGKDVCYSKSCATYCSDFDVCHDLSDGTLSANFNYTYDSSDSCNPSPYVYVRSHDDQYHGEYNTDLCVSQDYCQCWNCSDGLKNDDELYIDWGGWNCHEDYTICGNSIHDIDYELEKDYGGICGQCANVTSENDYVYWFARSIRTDFLQSYWRDTTGDNGWLDEYCVEAGGVGGVVISLVVILCFSLVLILAIFVVIYLYPLYRSYKSIKQTVSDFRGKTS